MRHPNRNASVLVDVTVPGDDNVERTWVHAGDPYHHIFAKPGVRSYTTRRMGVPVKLTRVLDV